MGPKKELRFFESNIFDSYPNFFDKYLFLKENKRYVIVTLSIHGWRVNAIMQEA